MSANKESWGSRVGLILAMAGNAVGLGNFLRFPVQAVQNGGGAFIIPYLICFLVMGIPLLWIEWSMGRFGGKFGHHSTPFIVDTMHKNRLWKYIGVFGIWTNIAVASYYCYLESWTLSYVFHSLGGTFSGLDQIGVSNFFDEYVSLGESTFGIPYEPIFFFVICLLLNTWILSQGLAKGVERVAKIGMPLLIVFGMFLAYKGFTITAGENGAINDSSVGLNFLWTPNFDELWSPTVWLAAAGQIFFTLSVGMGTIHCYASYVRSKDDIALNAMSAGWMNEFVEVVLGASILIPISIGYLGIDGVVDLVNKQGGLGLGFRTLPYLFYQWGDVLGAVAGVMWFGLLFFAGITSSLAMGTPWIGFLQDEFNWRRRPAAWSFGLIVLVLGMPTVLFFKYGVFDEYDYWAGTVSLVVFALFESILFAWVFGMNKGWREITSGADIKVPGIYKFIIKFVTPLLLLWVFIGSLITPKGGDWAGALSNGWELDDSSIINKIKNSNLKRQLAEATDPAVIEQLQDTLFFVNASRILLVVVFLSIAALVYIAYKKRVREGRI
ncbi:sodium-dependent transporter [Pontibacter virosus]|uniref:SNF family Na+-dependent transporter n=1 Tax=Pontibacter virosus TaxID=1765052 RepID=A0A2U1B5D6_9BACT|nr:sodium-dependent transporter [Pontibacter virosus]PVY43811.1 SNF family Na+-dependent transporter [Pontibacter virosus]